MSKVYVLHDNPGSTKNFLPAEEYGELFILFDYHISFTHIGRCISQLRDKLRGASKDDWLIPVGHPALILAAGHVWFDITSQMNILVWDQQMNKYVPVRINTHGRNSQNNQDGARIEGIKG